MKQTYKSVNGSKKEMILPAIVKLVLIIEINLKKSRFVNCFSFPLVEAQVPCMFFFPDFKGFLWQAPSTERRYLYSLT